ncbi:MAG: flippase activity-associated protein Agl23 [Halorhabdus sp.]
MAEAADATDTPSTGRVGDRARRFVSENPVVAVVAALTVVGLVTRFAFLGVRVAHWDEARVAYWVVHSLETGHFAYNSHTHGPFVQHVDRYLFALFGASDFMSRVPVAIVGGLLPLSALLFRDHLDDVETVFFAGVLSFNSVLLYYSRFMRSDLLVATFMFTAFGLLVRFYDTRKPRYVYGATVLIVFGIASKENAPLYVLTWLGAGALAFDAALYRPRKYRSGTELVVTKLLGYRQAISDRRAEIWRYLGHAVGVTLVFVAVFVFMFAPRGGGWEGMLYPPAGPEATLGLWEAMGKPWTLPQLTRETFAYVVYPNAEYFAFGGIDGVIIDFPGPPAIEGTDNSVPYLERLGSLTAGLLKQAGVVIGFAALGFLRERYAAARSRTLVLFMTYAGVASILGYPLTFSIGSGWKWGMTHMIVPLAIPAAVGLAIVGRWAIDAYDERDLVNLGLTSLVIGIVTVAVFVTAISGAYGATATSDENPLVQYGQPGEDMRPALDSLRQIAADHDGTDVAIYDGSTADGGSFVRSDPGSAWKDFRPVCTEWGNTLPINWYLAADGADTECFNETAALENETLGEDPVPIVITRGTDSTVPVSALEEDYHGLTYPLRTYGSEATFWIHEDYWSENR